MSVRDETADAEAPSQSRVLKGSSWQLGFRALEEVVGFGVGIALARLLLPEDFGLVAMVGVFIGLADLLRTFGLQPALVQAAEVSDRDVSTVLWFSLGVGCCLFLLFACLAIPLSKFYGEPRLVRLTMLMGISFVVGAPTSCYYAILIRAFKFRALGMANLIGRIVGAAVGILLAIKGHGPSALVAMSLTSTVFRFFACALLARWKPSMSFSYANLRRFLWFGGTVTLDQVFAYCCRTGDNLLVGRFLGGEILGQYKKAYSMMMMPLIAMQTSWSVSFSALSRLHGDIKRCQSAYLKISRWLLFITLPAMLGLAAIASPFTVGVYGAKWLPAAAILPALCIGGACRSVTFLAKLATVSQGRPDLALRLSVVDGVAMVASFVVGIALGGVRGVAWAYALWSLGWVYPCTHYSLKVLGLSVADQGRNVCGIVLVSVAMALSVLYTWRSRVFGMHGPLVETLILAALGGLLYPLLLRMFRVKVLGEVWLVGRSALGIIMGRFAS